jgi:hypothetical protein
MRPGVFLDDERKVSDVKWIKLPNDVLWFTVRSYDRFVNYVEWYWHEHGKLPEVFSFDHDLAWNHYTDIGQPIDYSKKEKTGYHCATWLTHFMDANGLKTLPEFHVHSMNPVGKQNIFNHLMGWEFNTNGAMNY